MSSNRYNTFSMQHLPTKCQNIHHGNTPEWYCSANFLHAWTLMVHLYWTFSLINDNYSFCLIILTSHFVLFMYASIVSFSSMIVNHHVESRLRICVHLRLLSSLTLSCSWFHDYVVEYGSCYILLIEIQSYFLNYFFELEM